MLNRKNCCDRFVDVVVPTLTSLFNLSIESESFPSILKLAKVTPLFKKDYKQDPSNNKAISILATMSKFF